MRNIILGMSAFALAAVATPAFAQEAETPAVTISGGATLVTDYRFRGISQSRLKPALQGGVDWTHHDSGFYLGFWFSSIRILEDIPGGKGPVELEELAQLARNGAVQPATMVWTEGMANWQRVAEIPGLAPGASSPPAMTSSVTLGAPFS